MSLNWSTENVQYFKDHPDDLWITYDHYGSEVSDVNVETKSLIFGSMVIGIGNINYKYAPSFYARWKVLEKFDDFYLYSSFNDNEKEYVYLTPEVVIKHVGLSTNVGYESDTEWIKRIAKSYERDFNSGRKTTLATAGMIKSYLNEKKTEFENSALSTTKIGE